MECSHSSKKTYIPLKGTELRKGLLKALKAKKVVVQSFFAKELSILNLISLFDHFNEIHMQKYCLMKRALEEFHPWKN